MIWPLLSKKNAEVVNIHDRCQLAFFAASSAGRFLRKKFTRTSMSSLLKTFIRRRVRVLEDDHAQQLAAETHSPEGAVFLVRLD
jgi:hypothetical protein